MRRSALLIFLLLALVAGACTYETQEFTVTIPEQAESTTIFDRNDEEILTLVGFENRILARDLDEIPETLQNAVLAIEDERFYLHEGIDLRGLIRAARTNVEAGGITQGGSTITQQYVKLAILEDDEKTASRKVEELWTAKRLEDQFGKEYILREYLNTIYFGEGAYGVIAAAETYFDKTLDELTLAEAAMIAGMIQRPSAQNPIADYQASLERSRDVMDRMLDTGYIFTTADHVAAREALGLPALDPTSEARGPQRLSDGLTDDQVEQVREYLAPIGEKRHADALGAAPVAKTTSARIDGEYPAAHFVDAVKEWFLDDPEFAAFLSAEGEATTRSEREQMLFSGGLRIETSIDLELQAQAEDAVARILPANGQNPDAAAVTIDPSNGHVLAMVGGRDFFGDSQFAKVNLAIGKGRQAGSSMKPIGLAAYLKFGPSICPGCGRVTDEFPAPSSLTLRIPGIGEPWKVSGGGGGGRVSLVQATRKSMNTVFAQLMESISPERFVTMAHELGITTDIAPVYAGILGTEDVTTLDMASVYSTFAASGVHRDPVLVTKITRSDGTVLYEALDQPERILEPDIANQISWVLSGVLQPGGTGTSAEFGRPAAGKTGTAQNFADATFVGYTPQRATAVWVGFPEGQIPMVPPRTDRNVFGGSYPAEMWREIMIAAHADLPVAEFPTPPSSTTSTTTTLTPPPPESLPPGEAAAVPNVVGSTEGQATSTLAAAGFSVATTTIESAIYAPGTVVGQSPAAGASLPTGSAVTLEVTVAKPEPQFAKVPNLVGLTEGEARQTLAGQGFGVNVVVAANPDDPALSPGTVWSQSPGNGANQPAGDVVTIRVAP